MGSESKPWLIWWAVAASAAVHAGAAAGVAAFSFALPSGDAAVTSEIDFTVLDVPTDETMPIVEPVPTLEPPPEARDPRPRLATLVPSGVPTPTLFPPVEPPTTDAPDTTRDHERDRPRTPISLDPASVAAAAIIFEDDPPARRGESGPSAPGDQNREEELEDALSGALSAAANARPHVSRRPPPRLRPRRDGTYVFRGHLFDAVIERDGTVRFADRGGAELDTPSLTRPDGLLPSGTFDISDSIERARGQDPFRHERHWFMQQTRELRERLADQIAEGERTRGMARMNGSLRRLWRGPRGAPAKRRQIFSMWDDCAEDEVGRRARAAILTFIHRTLPRGSANAFTQREIDALNAQRLSREAFEPY